VPFVAFPEGTDPKNPWLQLVCGTPGTPPGERAAMPGEVRRGRREDGGGVLQMRRPGRPRGAVPEARPRSRHAHRLSRLIPAANFTPTPSHLPPR
jgi:hypothetical protein